MEKSSRFPLIELQVKCIQQNDKNFQKLAKTTYQSIDNLEKCEMFNLDYYMFLTNFYRNKKCHENKCECDHKLNHLLSYNPHWVFGLINLIEKCRYCKNELYLCPCFMIEFVKIYNRWKFYRIVEEYEYERINEKIANSCVSTLIDADGYEVCDV